MPNKQNSSTVQASKFTSTEPQFMDGIVCTGHYFDVPIDYDNPAGGTIKVFAREVVSLDNKNKGRDDLPWLLFLQGGPGFQSPRPESNSGWLKRALQKFRVVLLDQRGTGLSTPVTIDTLPLISDPQKQFEYLRNFRADNIVRDSEVIRRELANGAKWTLLGQSYGGFCITTYLSFFPEALNGAIFTGGLPPLVDLPDEVYRATYKRAIEKNQEFYERYPDDAKLVEKVISYLSNNEVRLPCGEILTPRRFLQIGLNFGFKSAGMHPTHYLLESAFTQSPKGETLSYAFLHSVEGMAQFDTNPIYALLHEAIYCQGSASTWSAERVMKEYPEFSSHHRPHYFTGEMIYSWMFDDFKNLKPFKKSAQMLADYTDWPKIYDKEALLQNSVPCAAAIYFGDMYVDRLYSEETAKTIKGLKFWYTNEHEHDGLRMDGERLLDRLLGLLEESRNLMR